MVGANDIGTLAVPIGQIAAVGTRYGAVTIAGQSQQNTGDVTASIARPGAGGLVRAPERAQEAGTLPMSLRPMLLAKRATAATPSPRGRAPRPSS